MANCRPEITTWNPAAAGKGSELAIDILPGDQPGVQPQNGPSENFADSATLIRSRPSLNITRQIDGTISIEVRCQTGRRYIIQTSINLVDWTPEADFVSDQPTILFQESTATNIGQRFYRILAP